MAASEASSWATTWSRFCSKCECSRVEPRLMRDSVAIIRLISLLLVSMRMAELRGGCTSGTGAVGWRTDLWRHYSAEFYVTQSA
ncbi:hypothetical protein D3C85_1419330 [compost metagenome]